MQVLDKIKAAYEREVRENKSAVCRDDIPISYEAITKAWLTEILCADHPGAEVVAHRLDTPDEGNSNRRRIFVEYNDIGRKAGLPASIFCKASQGFSNRVSLGITGAIYSEVTFYKSIRPLLSIEAPECCFANYNPDSFNSIIVLKDLGKDTTFCTHTTAMSRERAEAQLRLFAAFHGQFYGDAQKQAALAPLLTWPDYFEKVQVIGLAQACDKGFGAAEGILPARLFSRRAQVWPATLASVARHRQLPHTLLHCDPHLRNWYITRDGRMGLTDWQTATRGHWSRDFAYMLATSLSVEQRALWEEDLLRYYLDQMHAVSGIKIDFSDAMTAYRQQLFTALAWWTITLSPADGMPDMQPRDATLEFIKRIATAIDDLDALDSFN